MPYGRRMLDHGLASPLLPTHKPRRDHDRLQNPTWKHLAAETALIAGRGRGRALGRISGATTREIRTIDTANPDDFQNGPNQPDPAQLDRITGLEMRLEIVSTPKKLQLSRQVLYCYIVQLQ